jgi:eukaryotic-like serine/threonine-protein kinase
MSHPRKLLKDGLTIGNQFRLVQQLGQGGMGTVWSAEDLRLGRPVAIKFLSHAFLNDQQARNRFAREPRLASKIRSPHVVQVYSEGTTEDDVPYLVMELLEGEDLATRIAREGPCSLAEAGAIVEQVCRALGRAHREGLVHRDIKPHNIFLSAEGDGQVFVKLLDFGIAKDVGSRITALTLSGEVVGSALYVSPEQLHEAASVGPSADIWSLGIVIYELISGQVPFEGRSLPELFMRIVEGQYTPVSQLGRGLPSALDGFFQQIIQRDPNSRFQSVDELAAAFARIVRANSSGLLLKPQTRRALPVAPAPPPISPLSESPADEPTERVPKPWPRAVLMFVAAVAIIAAAYLLRMRRPDELPEAVPPALAQPAVPAAAVRPEAPPAAEAPQPRAAGPADSSNAVAVPSQPAAAEDLPSGRSPGADTSRKPKPKLAAEGAAAPRSNPASTVPMPRNHGF